MLIRATGERGVRPLATRHLPQAIDSVEMTRRAFLSALAAGTGSLLCGPLQADVLQEGKADVTLGIGAVRVEVAPGHTVATTGFCGILDATSHTFRYCNAGHPYPILVS